MEKYIILVARSPECKDVIRMLFMCNLLIFIYLFFSLGAYSAADILYYFCVMCFLYRSYEELMFCFQFKPENWCLLAERNHVCATYFVHTDQKL